MAASAAAHAVPATVLLGEYWFPALEVRVGDTNIEYLPAQLTARTPGYPHITPVHKALP